MSEQQEQKKNGSKKSKNVFLIAFPYTIPVLTGYLAIGFAFGVMFQEIGYNWLWAAFMSLLVYAGSGQYLAVNFFVPGFSFLNMIFMTLMVNIRHIFYGLSLLDRTKKMAPAKRWYITFGLTDETYSLLTGTKTPEGVDEEKFLFAISVMDQSYWIAGSILGSLFGAVVNIDMTGVDFAMTALFVVIFLEQWLASKNHLPALLGMVAAVLCILLFGRDNFVLPTMIVIMSCLLIGKRWFEKNEKEEVRDAD